MPQATFILSAFGDEIDNDLETQLDVLASEGIFALELRSAWGKNVLELDEEQLAEAGALLQKYGFQVSAIGSPIGKSDLSRPREFELERLDRAIAAARALDTRLIRVFSFYIPTGENAADHRDEVLARMAALTDRAELAGCDAAPRKREGHLWRYRRALPRPDRKR